MRNVTVLLAAFLLALVPSAFGQTALDPRSADAIREAERQEGVSGDMTRLVDDFRSLVADLKSNGVFTEAEGDAYVAMADDLGQTDQGHVRVAADHLRRAGADYEGRASHVNAAEGEIKIALEQLTDLLRQANALRAGELIAGELAEIIKAQEKITEQSAEVGRELLQGKAAPSRDPKELAREQQKIAERAVGLQRLFKEALGEEMPPDALEKLTKAAQLMDQGNVTGLLQDASRSLDRKDMIPAVTGQKEALNILKEMARLLSDYGNPLTPEEQQALDDLLKDQRELREQTEAMSPDQFKEKSDDLQLAEMNLIDRLNGLPTGEEPAPGTPPTGEPPAPNSPSEDGEPNPGQTEDAMEQAAVALGQQQQQEAVAAMLTAEQGLMAAKGGSPMPGQGKGPEGPGEGGGKSDIVQKPGQGEAHGESPSPGQGKGPPGDLADKGQGKGQVKGQGQNKGGLARNTPGSRPANPTAGDRQFQPTGVYGERPDGDRSFWSSLSRQERSALSQSFARELPREYRDMLQAYYERLSRQP